MNWENPQRLDRETLETIEVLRKLPAAPIHNSMEIENIQWIRCHCDVLVEKAEELRVRWSGYIYYQDNICKKCRSEFDSDVKIMCVGCKGRIVIRVPPGKDKHGFVTVKDSCLHVMTCRICNPELKESPILEKVQYLKRNNIKV